MIASWVGSQPPILNPGTGVWTIKSWNVMKKEKVKLQTKFIETTLKNRSFQN